MLKRNRIILGVAAGLVVLWFILYSFLISPNWSEWEREKAAADDQIGRWVKLYKPQEGTLPLPEATKALDDEQAMLQTSLKDLNLIEFTVSMPGFTNKDIGKGDPNNYFDQKQKEVAAYVTKSLKLNLTPGLEDLGFQSKLKKDSVPLNLTRLFVLKRLMEAAKASGIQEILKIDYLQPESLSVGREEELVEEPESDKKKGDTEEKEGKEGKEGKEEKEVKEVKEEKVKKGTRIFQIPLIVRVRSPERDFARFLFQLQQPSGKELSYFCLRGVLVAVGEDAQGKVDSQVAVGALFPEDQYLKDLEIPYEEKSQSRFIAPRPVIDPSRY